MSYFPSIRRVDDDAGGEGQGGRDDPVGQLFETQTDGVGLLGVRHDWVPFMEVNRNTITDTRRRAILDRKAVTDRAWVADLE